MENLLRYLIESESFIVCDLLPTSNFISFCEKRGFRVYKEQLEQFEKLGIFHPMARVRYLPIKQKIEVLNDSQGTRILGILEEGEEWGGKIMEDFSYFDFEKKQSINWYENNLLWDPSLKPFLKWKYFWNEKKKIKIENFYSIFQCFELYYLIKNLTLEVRLEFYSEEKNTNNKDEFIDISKSIINGIRRRKNLLADLCQAIANRYFPLTKTDKRTFLLSQNSRNFDWDWYKYCREWNPQSILKIFDLQPEDILEYHEDISLRARWIDPLANWYNLVSFISVDKKEKLKDGAFILTPI